MIPKNRVKLIENISAAQTMKFTVSGGITYIDEDESTSPGFFGQLPYEEDFGILLLRVGTASLEATGLRGWNNEVAPIPLPVKSRNRNRTRGNPQTYGVVRMGRIDVAEVQYGSSSYATASSSNSSNPYDDLSLLSLMCFAKFSASSPQN